MSGRYFADLRKVSRRRTHNRPVSTKEAGRKAMRRVATPVRGSRSDDALGATEASPAARTRIPSMTVPRRYGGRIGGARPVWHDS